MKVFFPQVLSEVNITLLLEVKFYIGLYSKELEKKYLAPRYKSYDYQHGYVALSGGLSLATIQCISVGSNLNAPWLCQDLRSVHSFIKWTATKTPNYSPIIKFGPAQPEAQSLAYRNFRKDGCWFDPWLIQYSFRELMIVIATGFTPLSPLSIVSTMIMWESSHRLGKDWLKELQKRWIGALVSKIYLK